MMTTQDTCCTLHPYFKISEGNLDVFKNVAKQLVERTANEEKCMFYAFSFDGDQGFCREGYVDAEGLLAHLDNVGDLLEKALAISEISRLEVHVPATEIEKLREPLAALNPQFFTLEHGFRK